MPERELCVPGYVARSEVAPGTAFVRINSSIEAYIPLNQMCVYIYMYVRM